jgi:hypothetical protein
MHPTEIDTIPIPNAPWWEAHSFVVVKEDFLAEDEAWIQNRMSGKVKVDASNRSASMDTQMGNVNILLIQRMVTSGKVAVKRSSGRIKEVNLPQDAPRLLKSDQDYIIAELNNLNPDMTEEEQESFLPSANGHSKTSSEMASSSLPSS